MIRTQRWSPDNCADPSTGDVCSFLETWDDADPPGSRPHVFKSREKACSVHGQWGPLKSYVVAVLHNRGLAAKANFLLNNIVSASQDVNNVWQVNFGANLTADQKTQLQGFIDNHFGSGKVVIS